MPGALATPDLRYSPSIQEQFLHTFHSSIAPNQIAPSSSSHPIWLTPQSCDLHFNSFFKQNVLQRLLASRTSRLRVVRVSNGVFKVWVASQNVSNALVIVGVLRLGSSSIFLHSSFLRAFEKLPNVQAESQGVNAAYLVSTSNVLRATAVTAYPLQRLLSDPRQHGFFSLLLNAPASTPPARLTCPLRWIQWPVLSPTARLQPRAFLGLPPDPPLTLMLSFPLPNPNPRPGLW